MVARFAFLFLILVGWLPQTVFPQSVSSGSVDIPITEQEKAVLRKFTKDFIRRLTKSRDVRPFLKSDFAQDFETFFYHYLLADESTDEPQRVAITRSEKKKVVVAMLNYMVVLAPFDLADPEFETNWPAGLRQKYRRFTSQLDDGDLFNTKQRRQRWVRDAEALHRGVYLHLRKHPVERTKSYLDSLRRRESIDDYNYSITEDVPDPDAENEPANWLKSIPGARTYLVGTPVGLCVLVIKIRGKLKVLYLMPWPISYDSRLDN